MNLRPLLPVFLIATALALHAGTTLESKITAVTIYPDRAIVTRSAEIELAVGEQELVFENLPLEVADDSLQVSGVGTAKATILEVTPRAKQLEVAPNPRIGTIEAAIKSLSQRRRVITDRTATLDREMALLGQIANSATTPPQGGKDGIAARQNPADWQQVVDFYDSGLEKLAAERRSLDREVDDLDAKIAALGADLTGARGGPDKKVKNVTVRVSIEKEGHLSLTLSYAVPDARWWPSYDARLSTAEQRLTLGYFGMVSQRTGEDWENVSMNLSTSRPSQGGAAPELHPWVVQEKQYLQPERPAPDGAPASGGEGVTVLSPFEVETTGAQGYLESNSISGTRVGAPPPPSYHLQPSKAAVAVRATSAEFHIPVSTSVPCDGAPHRVGIATLPFATSVCYLSTPKLNTAAFLGATVTNDTTYPLLGGGWVASYLDGMFVSRGFLKTAMPGEKFDLPFGADEGIHIERKLINRFAKDVGFVTGQVRVTYEVLTTVTNNKTIPVTVKVTDQVPLSRNENVKVSQVTPDSDEMKPDANGLLVWILDLKPGEKRDISLKFTVTFPRDFAIDGLE